MYSTQGRTMIELRRHPVVIGLILALLTLGAGYRAPVRAQVGTGDTTTTTSPPPTAPPATSPPATTPPDTTPPPTAPPATNPPATNPPDTTPPPAASPPAASPPAASPATDAPADGPGPPASIVSNGPLAEILPLKPAAPPLGDGIGAGGVDAPRLGDGQVAAILDSLQRSGASSTAPLIEALRPLEALGFSAGEAAILGMGAFPVAGRANYRDDWHDARLTPVFHLHKGNDIFAAFDTPVKSPAEGVVRVAEEAVGGKSVYVTAADGTYYYMAHLSGFAADLTTGATVTAGQVVGYTGDSGNARGGAPHVHFEVHPAGGEAVNPKPILDGWLNDAIARVPDLVANYRAQTPEVLVATGLTRQFDVRSFEGAARPPDMALLWASSVSTGGGGLRLAEVELARAAESVDWDGRTAAALEKRQAETQAAEMAITVLAPLTPAPLAPLMAATHAAGGG